MKVRLLLDEYCGRFQKKDSAGRWYKFAQMGNAGVALDIAGILRKLGHDVEVVEQLMDMEEAQ
jgi:hypothetical protein